MSLRVATIIALISPVIFAKDKYPYPIYSKTDIQFFERVILGLCCLILLVSIGFTVMFIVIHRLLKKQRIELKMAISMLLHRLNLDYENEKEDNSLVSRNATHTNLSIFDSNI